MNNITLWILEVFFGVFFITTTINYYIHKKSLNWFHSILWFASAIIFAIITGLIFS